MPDSSSNSNEPRSLKESYGEDTTDENKHV